VRAITLLKKTAFSSDRISSTPAPRPLRPLFRRDEVATQIAFSEFRSAHHSDPRNVRGFVAYDLSESFSHV